MRNRQWILKRRPKGLAAIEDFERRETAASERALRPGEILFRNRMLLCAPTMRNWMSGQRNSLFRTIEIGSVVDAPAAGDVVASENGAFPVGARVMTLGSWQDFQIIDPTASGVGFVPDGMSFADAMGRYGLNSQTGYFGMLRVGAPRKGETVVVSGAAGATGSVAAQVARIAGASVIGIAGSAEKCRWLVSDCRLDAAINYKKENLRRRLSELCPDGIDVFFDNVGGETLQAAVDTMAKYGRIVLCGQIASYNDDALPEGPRNMMRVIYGGLRLQGFLVSDYAAETAKAIEDLQRWTDQGLIAHRVDLRRGFDTLPATFNELFTGGNNGALLVELD